MVCPSTLRTTVDSSARIHSWGATCGRANPGPAVRVRSGRGCPALPPAWLGTRSDRFHHPAQSHRLLSPRRSGSPRGRRSPGRPTCNRATGRRRSRGLRPNPRDARRHRTRRRGETGSARECTQHCVRGARGTAPRSHLGFRRRVVDPVGALFRGP